MTARGGPTVTRTARHAIVAATLLLALHTFAPPQRPAPSTASSLSSTAAAQALSSGAPEFVAEYGGQLWSLATDDRHLYATLHSRLLVFDPDDLEDAAPLAVSAPSGAAVTQLAAREGMVAGVGAELIIWDATDLGQLRERNRLSLRQATVEELLWVGHELWLLLQDGSIRRIDLARPEQPKSAGTWLPPRLVDTFIPRAGAMISLGDAAVVLLEYFAEETGPDTFELIVLQPDADGAIQELGFRTLPAPGTNVAHHGDRLIVTTRDLRLMGLDLGPDLHPTEPEDMARAPKAVAEGAQRLVYDGTRLWALQADGLLAEGRPEGGDWLWKEHFLVITHIAPAAKTARSQASLAILGDAAPALMDADGSLVSARARQVQSWDRVIPGKEGSWLIGYDTWGYVKFGHQGWEAVAPPPGFDGDRTPALDDGADMLFGIDQERIFQWRLEAGRVVPVGFGLAAAAGLHPYGLLAADPGRLLIAAIPLDEVQDPSQAGAWLLELTPDGELLRSVPVPLEGGMGWPVLSQSAVWDSSSTVLHAYDLRGPGPPEAVPDGISFAPGGISSLAARQAIVAVGTGLGLSFIDGRHPERQRIVGTLDMPEPFIFSLAVAPPYVWSTSSNFSNTTLLSLVDAGVLDHPTEIGQRSVSLYSHELRARGPHAWLLDNGVVQLFRAPRRPATPTAPPTGSASGTPGGPGTPGTPASPTWSPVPTTSSPTPNVMPPGRAWLPRTLVGRP
jgi:hypothetical protein